MADDFYLQEEENNAEDDKRKPGIVNWQSVHRIKGKYQTDDTDDTGKDRTRIIQLEYQTDSAELKKNEGDIRIAQDIQ